MLWEPQQVANHLLGISGIGSAESVTAELLESL